jgi:hypothetical protein
MKTRDFSSWEAAPITDVRSIHPMSAIERSSLPAGALLDRYRREGGYVDCYATSVSGRLSHEQYVCAFYTTALFKVERFILRWIVSRPSTDADAAALASGASDTFAAWHVEARTANELLLCDLTGRTRSWLMVAPAPAGTRLYFGSAVIPRSATGRHGGLTYRALMRFHRIYSVALLAAARRRLQTQL